MAVQLSAVAPTLLPPTITGPIFAKAAEQSAVMSLARRVPLSVTAQTAIPVPMDIPVAGWVAEGGVKPVSQEAMGVKLMTGKKLALLLPVSEEIMRTNAAGLYSQIQQDLPTAMSRAFDQAAINGKDMRSGGAGPFSDYLALTQNTQALGTATAAQGGIYTDLVTGMGKVVDRNYDFTGFVADPRMKIDALLSIDTIGRPLFIDAPYNGVNDGGGLGQINSTLASTPVAFSKGVSGKYWRAGDSGQVVTITGSPTGGTFTLASGGNTTTPAYNATGATIQTTVQSWGGIYAGVTVTGSASGPYTITFPSSGNVQATAAPFQANGKGLTGGTNPAATVVATGAGGTDTLLRAVGGDFSQCAYGVGMDISMRISQEASYWDGANWHSAFQENLVLLLIEAYYGFVVGDPNAFCLYTKGTAAL
jgi:hypothetical protein